MLLPFEHRLADACMRTITYLSVKELCPAARHVCSNVFRVDETCYVLTDGSAQKDPEQIAACLFAASQACIETLICGETPSAALPSLLEGAPFSFSEAKKIASSSGIKPAVYVNFVGEAKTKIVSVYCSPKLHYYFADEEPALMPFALRINARTFP